MSDVDEPIAIVTPDHEWPRRYTDERERVRTALGVAVSSIELFGSTAVPGLVGKPIIDILVGVHDLQAAKTLTPSLTALSYEDFGEIFVAGRVYLRKRDVVPGFNLAITEVGGAFWNASVAVRDYLLAHPSEVDAYAQHKRDAVARGATLFSSYSRDKEPFVAALRDRALAWVASQPGRIRSLTDGDAEAVRALRLRAVRQEPDPFASAYEDERTRSTEDTAAFLRSLRGSDSEMLGLFVGSQLLAMVGLRRQEGRRVRHRVTVFSMYVAPEARRRGHGTALLDAAIADACARGGVEQLELTVATSSAAARELYLRAGFAITGRLTNALKDGDRHLDEELLILPLGHGR